MRRPGDRRGRRFGGRRDGARGGRSTPRRRRARGSRWRGPSCETRGGPTRARGRPRRGARRGTSSRARLGGVQIVAVHERGGRAVGRRRRQRVAKGRAHGALPATGGTHQHPRANTILGHPRHRGQVERRVPPPESDVERDEHATFSRAPSEAMRTKPSGRARVGIPRRRAPRPHTLRTAAHVVYPPPIDASRTYISIPCVPTPRVRRRPPPARPTRRMYFFWLPASLREFRPSVIGHDDSLSSDEARSAAAPASFARVPVPVPVPFPAARVLAFLRARTSRPSARAAIHQSCIAGTADFSAASASSASASAARTSSQRRLRETKTGTGVGCLARGRRGDAPRGRRGERPRKYLPRARLLRRLGRATTRPARPPSSPRRRRAPRTIPARTRVRV